MKKICENCSEEFETNNKIKRFCCRKCKSKKYQKTHRKEFCAYAKKFRDNNKEKIKKDKKIYVLKHKEEIKKYQQKHRLENIDKIKFRDNEYNRTHKEQRAIGAKKRILKFREKWYPKKCSKCNSNEMLSFHHIDPKIKIDSVARMIHKTDQEIQAEIDKCVIICHVCHMKLHAKLRRSEKQCVF